MNVIALSWWHDHVIDSFFLLRLQPKIVEENLTYAELDLVKPIPDATAKRSGTVYAQILFEEQQLWDQICLFLFIFGKKKKNEEAEIVFMVCIFCGSNNTS